MYLDSCHNLPGQLYDAIAREGSFGMEVSLGPSGSWFWKNAWRNGRDIHLSALDAVINQELYENRRTLDWIGFGRNSGVAIYSDGVRSCIVDQRLFLIVIGISRLGHPWGFLKICCK